MTKSRGALLSPFLFKKGEKNETCTKYYNWSWSMWIISKYRAKKKGIDNIVIEKGNVVEAIYNYPTHQTFSRRAKN